MPVSEIIIKNQEEISLQGYYQTKDIKNTLINS